MWLLLAGVHGLLIACGNASNLLLARAASRLRELACALHWERDASRIIATSDRGGFHWSHCWSNRISFAYLFLRPLPTSIPATSRD